MYIFLLLSGIFTEYFLILGPKKKRAPPPPPALKSSVSVSNLSTPGPPVVPLAIATPHNANIYIAPTSGKPPSSDSFKIFAPLPYKPLNDSILIQSPKSVADRNACVIINDNNVLNCNKINKPKSILKQPTCHDFDDNFDIEKFDQEIMLQSKEEEKKLSIFVPPSPDLWINREESIESWNGFLFNINKITDNRIGEFV